MIENTPTADDLRFVSLRLYFKAWSSTTAIFSEWAEYGVPIIEEDADLGPSWHGYIDAVQSDLQAIYTLIQQSQEIGLKARICDVSPFLLLKRTDIKAVDDKIGIWDFTDFPTLDASELIRVHNIFCSTTLSKEFQIQYEEIRRNRNKIFHLGIYKQRIEPQVIIDLLQMQFAELYPGRRWLEDRLHFSALSVWSDYSNSDFNEVTGLFYEFRHLIPQLSEGQFENLFGHDREEPRYICFSCAYEAGLGNHDLEASDVPTAYLDPDKSQAHCVICDKFYATKVGDCPDPTCGCTFLSAETDSQDQCMRCGTTTEDWERSQRVELGTSFKGQS